MPPFWLLFPSLSSLPSLSQVSAPNASALHSLLLFLCEASRLAPSTPRRPPRPRPKKKNWSKSMASLGLRVRLTVRVSIQAHQTRTIPLASFSFKRWALGRASSSSFACSLPSLGSVSKKAASWPSNCEARFSFSHFYFVIVFGNLGLELFLFWFIYFIIGSGVWSAKESILQWTIATSNLWELGESSVWSSNFWCLSPNWELELWLGESRRNSKACIGFQEIR